MLLSSLNNVLKIAVGFTSKKEKDASKDVKLNVEHSSYPGLQYSPGVTLTNENENLGHKKAALEILPKRVPENISFERGCQRPVIYPSNESAFESSTPKKYHADIKNSNLKIHKEPVTELVIIDDTSSDVIITGQHFVDESKMCTVRHKQNQLSCEDFKGDCTLQVSSIHSLAEQHDGQYYGKLEQDDLFLLDSNKDEDPSTKKKPAEPSTKEMDWLSIFGVTENETEPAEETKFSKLQDISSKELFQYLCHENKVKTCDCGLSFFDNECEHKVFKAHNVQHNQNNRMKIRDMILYNYKRCSEQNRHRID